MITSVICKQKQIIQRIVFNSLPNDKILALTKFKTFADDKTTVTQKLKSVLGRVENIVGKGETTGYRQI